MSLDQERARILAVLEAGEATCCGACGQMIRVYQRKLNSQMAAFLCLLIAWEDQHGPGFHDVRKFLGGTHKVSSDGTYLVHWYLVEGEEGHRGMWRSTARGRAFAQEGTTVPSHVHLLRNVRVGQSSLRTTMARALGDKFNLDELMAQG